MPQHLFAYGTLRPGHAPPAIAPIVRRLTLIGPATIRGTKVELGDYPGLLIGPNHNDEVAGTVFALPADPDVLAALDDYEDFRPNDPDASLFVRSQQSVTLADGGRMLCWVYLYHRAV